MTPANDDRQAVREAADRLLARSELIGGELEEPVPVVGPDGELTAWFVPVITGVDLVGFLLMTPQLRHDCWSVFTHRPRAAQWIDPEIVARRAGALAPVVGEPVLSYDGKPSRVAWAVPTRRGTVYVAGDAAWLSAR